MKPFPRPVVAVLSLALATACGGGSLGSAEMTEDVRAPDFVSSSDNGGTTPRPDAPTQPDTGKPGCTGDGDCRFMTPRPGQCEVATCEVATGACILVNKTNGALCDDSYSCTSRDLCQEGVCVGSDNVCDCANDADCAASEDDNLCNGTLVCDRSSTRYECVVDPATVVTCDTSRDTTCMGTVCVPELGACVSRPRNEGQLCNDDDACTSATFCTAEGTCVGEDLCQCRRERDCLAVEDGDLCNGTLFCDLSQIPYLCRVRTGTIVQCPPSLNPCQRNRCRPETGNCLPEPLSDDTPCDDRNKCSENDSCQAGECVGGRAKDCDDREPCTNDGCDTLTGNCLHTFNTGPCDAYWACSLGDMCEAGSCRRGETIDCDDGDPCTEDSCTEPTGCSSVFSLELCPPSPDVVGPGPDAGATDVSGAEDVPPPPPDIPVVTWPSEAEGLFRLETLGWLAPELCSPQLPTECAPVTGTLSTRLSDELAGRTPAAVLVFVAPLDVEAAAAAVTWGNGDCTDDGTDPPACALSPAGPSLELPTASVSSQAACLPGAVEVGPPCFGSGEGDAILLLDLLGARVGLADARVYARYGAAFAQLEDGVVSGFLSEDAAAVLALDLPTVGPTTLAALLGQSPTSERNGTAGWWVRLSFTAGRVERVQ